MEKIEHKNTVKIINVRGSSKVENSEQLNELIETNENIAEYIAETGDISLQNGELLRDVWADINQELEDYLIGQKQNHEDHIKRLQIQIDKGKEQLKVLEDVGKKGSLEYRKLKEEVDANTRSLEENGKELKNNITKLRL